MPRRSKRCGSTSRKGYKAIRVQSGVPGLDKVYGVGKSKGYYEPAEKGLPPEEPWDTALYLRHTPELFRKVREAVRLRRRICCTTRTTG